MDYRKMISMAVPEDIRRVERPINTVVEARTNKDGITTYFVRERNGFTYSDGRSRPRNGGVIGFIINGKYVPKAEGTLPSPKEVDLITWAVEQLLMPMGEDILDDLRKCYPEKEAEMLLTMAILRIRHPELRNSRMKRDYRESTLSGIFPNLPMSKNGVCDFLQEVGSHGVAIQRFMNHRSSRLPTGTKLAVDGTLVTDNSCVNNLSAVSRKTRIRGNREVSILYAYDVSRGEPVCYSVYPGNLLDSKAYAQFIELHDLHNAMLVGDKAFTCQAAKKQFQSERGLNFLYPVRRNCKAIEKLKLDTQDKVLKTYPGVTYRIAEDDDGTYYYSFRDADRAASEELAFLEQKRKSGKQISSEDLEKLRRQWGTIIYHGDVELTAEQAYDTYRQRWLLEMMFDLYKNIEDFDDTRVQSDYSVIAEHFVNFISTILSNRLMSRFDEAGLLEKRTYGEVLDTLRRSLKFRNEEGEWIYRAQTDKEKEILRALDLMPKLPPKRGPGRPRKNP